MLNIEKASLLKRVSAWLLDIILIIILSVGFIALISWITGYQKYADEMQGYYDEYSDKYGINLNITEDEYNAMTEDEQESYNTTRDAAFEEMNKNYKIVKAYNICSNLIVIMLVFGILLSYLLLEFLVPVVFFKNGQTLGKKIFSIGLVNENCVGVTTFQVFVRTLFGKYTIETMVPVLTIYSMFMGNLGIVGVILLGGILLLQIILFLAKKERPFIHDVFAHTIVCDMNCQKIFKTEQDRIDYLKETSLEESKRS